MWRAIVIESNQWSVPAMKFRCPDNSMAGDNIRDGLTASSSIRHLSFVTRHWVVEIVQIAETVEVVYHRGQKSEIRDQLYPDL